jgi:sugar phosphate isomerase/epimerase
MGNEAVHGIFARLAANGLAGVEIDHEENTPYGRERLRVIAAELGLIVTGSSDYHGRGMKPVSPGAHTTSPEMFERIVSAASGSRVQWARTS